MAQQPRSTRYVRWRHDGCRDTRRSAASLLQHTSAMTAYVEDGFTSGNCRGAAPERGCRVTPSPDHGWEVIVDVNGQHSTVYCSDWHRVERICAQVRFG